MSNYKNKVNKIRSFAIVAFISVYLFSSCGLPENVLYAPDNDLIRYTGRIDFSEPFAPVLIGSASYAEMNFKGDSCQLQFRKLNPEGEHNYISVEIDGEDLGRFKIENSMMESITIHAKKQSESHNIKIFKATEASNNYIAFGGIYCLQLLPLNDSPSRKIEFIGNSITCGMGNDLTDIPCDAGLWYDQHNAYWAYGPIAARELNSQYLLSSVSGIGVYRNWNSLKPVMPDVYENMYLNTDDSKHWDFSSYVPDLVSICLGTNDMSLGDGVKERLPFDSAIYVREYISFVETIYNKYPETQVCLLTSPMVKGEGGQLLKRCLQSIQDIINEEFQDRKPLAVFEFPEGIEPHGCGYHPDINDHKQMAEAVLPFYRELMAWE